MKAEREQHLTMMVLTKAGRHPPVLKKLPPLNHYWQPCFPLVLQRLLALLSS